MKKILFGAVIAGSLLNVSCKKDPSEAPSIPPQNTLEMDFSDFQESSKSTEDTVDLTQGWFWGRSVTHVAVWNIVLAVNLAVPVASYAEAFNHTPSYVSKSKGWLWQYTVNHESGVYTCKLYGKKEDDGNHWRMEISKEGSFTDVEWYTGISQEDKSAGSWTLNKNAFNVTPYLQVDWSKDANTGVEQIKYTNIETGTDGEGSYITYGIDPSKDFDAFYEIYGAKEDNTVSISWNTTDKNGQIVEEHFYGDDLPRCWNSQALNDTCQ